MERMAASSSQRNSAGRGSGGSRGKTLPFFAVEKIMKKVLPEKTRISKEAKERVQESSSKFAAVIIKRAAQECMKDGSSMLDGRHIILALSNLGLNDYANELKNHPPQYWNIDETEPQPEPELEPAQEIMITRPTPEYGLLRLGLLVRDGGYYPDGILAVGPPEIFQNVPALILRKIY